MRASLLLVVLLVGCGGPDPGATETDDRRTQETVAPEPARAEPWILEGSVTIRNNMEAEALTGAVTITGNLEITGPGLRHLHGLEALQRVGGKLHIHQAPDLVDLSDLAQLAEVDGALVIEGVLLVSEPMGQDSMDSVQLPALTAVGGMLRLLNSGALSEARFPVLQSVGGNLDIINNPALPTCSATALAAQLQVAGMVSIRGNDDVTACP